MSKRKTARGSRASRAVAIGAGAGVGALLLGLAGARRARRIDLHGKVAVVTGGGRGLGHEIARQLAAQGCRLAICGRDGDVIDRAVNALRAEGTEVIGRACDASDEAQVGAFVAHVLDRYGAIDVLVNNAAQCFVGPAVELQAPDVQHALQHIFWVQYHPTMAVLPHMRGRRAGRIVNVTSFGGKVPTPHQAAYSAGKYAATGWSETLAIELRKDGIEVSTVAPPPLSDGAPMHAHFNGRAEEELLWFGRMLTSPFSATATERAARAVVTAARYGDTERMVSPSSWLAARAYSLAPNIVSRVLTLLDRRLPRPAEAGESARMRLGSEVAAGSRDARVHAVAASVHADEERYHPGSQAFVSSPT